MMKGNNFNWRGKRALSKFNKPTDSGKLNPRYAQMFAAQALVTVALLPAVCQLAGGFA
jgi:hypothetical protein